MNPPNKETKQNFWENQGGPTYRDTRIDNVVYCCVSSTTRSKTILIVYLLRENDNGQLLPKKKNSKWFYLENVGSNIGIVGKECFWKIYGCGWITNNVNKKRGEKWKK